MAKYSRKAGDKVEEVMHEMKKGKLKSGSGKKVTSRKQAIAIALSEARKEGAKVPGRKAAPKKKAAAKKKTAPKKKGVRRRANARIAPQKTKAKTTVKKQGRKAAPKKKTTGQARKSG
jgi:hypothetical protein